MLALRAKTERERALILAAVRPGFLSFRDIKITNFPTAPPAHFSILENYTIMISGTGSWMSMILQKDISDHLRFKSVGNNHHALSRRYRKAKAPGRSTARAESSPLSALARSARIIIVLVFCITVGTCPQNAYSNTTREDAETELTVIRKMIRMLSSRLTSARSAQDTAREQLRKTEVTIGKLVAELREVENRLQQQQRQLTNLRRQRNKQKKALLSQRGDFARQIRISYAMGRRDFLRIILNHEDPSALARAMTYHGYFNRVRLQRIKAARLHIERIHALERELDQKTLALEGLRRAKKKLKSDVEQYFRQRKKAHAKLSREIQRDDQRLTHLEQDKNRLERLIRDIKQAYIHIPASQQPFHMLKGRLRWPTVGSIRHTFGAKRSMGNLTWQGVWISARAGQPIHAISHGKVVFADWLRGFGLLMIIDHGGGYMSLYAHNQSLYRKVGDSVKPGEVIASVGNSGGNSDNGLYFEIRRKGSPRNPAYWCKSSPSIGGNS